MNAEQLNEGVAINAEIVKWRTRLQAVIDRPADNIEPATMRDIWPKIVAFAISELEAKIKEAESRFAAL